MKAASWVGLAAGLALVCGCGGSDDDPSRPAPADEPAPGGTVLGEQAGGRLRIGATSRFDLALGRPLAVRAGAGAGGSLQVSLRDRTGRAALAPAVTLPAGRTARLRVPVGATAARLAAGCEPLRLTVTVTARGETIERAGARIPAEAPGCARFFNPRSVWNRRLPADAEPDRRSETLVAELRRQVEDGYAKRFPPTINTARYSTPVYTVPAGQRRVPVELTRGQDYGAALGKVLAAGVPIPDRAVPAAGGDAHLVVWQPATDTMWELWTARRENGRWRAGWGGRMEKVSANPGYFRDPWGVHPGATASSLPLAGGLVTLRDLARGRIDHALGMAIPSTRSAVWSRPAQRTDGPARRTDAVPMGARFRLDPAVDVEALEGPPLTRMLARAAQEYGIYVRDTSPVVTLYGEDPTPTGQNPWARALAPSPSAVLRAFPWDRLALMPMDLRTYGDKRPRE